MFEIDFLITSSVYDRLNAFSCIEDKTDFLLNLIDFDINFPADISDHSIKQNYRRIRSASIKSR